MDNLQEINFEAWEVGERIRQARLDSHLTIQEVCEALRVSPQAFDKWQNGICLPTMLNMLRLSKLFDTTIEDLLVGEADDRSSVVLGENITKIAIIFMVLYCYKVMHYC